MLNDIDAAIEARVALAGVEIHWAGQKYDPRHGTPYLRARVVGRDRRPAGIGPNTPHQWIGILYLTVKEPVEDGTRAADARAVSVANLFRRGETLVSGAAKVQLESTTIQPLVETADWNEVTVAVSWFCWEP
jgi:hypothetical protein